jgi:hypothetical protein
MLKAKTYHAPHGEEVIRTEHTDELGRLHRSDGPAIECSNGLTAWYWEGRLHRSDGPAIECEGYKGWFLTGICQRAEFASGRTFAIQKD